MGMLKDWMCDNLRIGCTQRPELDEVVALTQQFHVTLRAYITKVEEVAQEPVPKALERIREIIAKGDVHLTWQDAYDIEQQLVQLYDEPTLRIELGRRLLEADQFLHPTVAHWYREQAGELHASADLGALLSRLINDLQWRYTRNEAKRGYTKDVTGRTEKVYAIAFTFFLLVLLPLAVLLATNDGVNADNLWLLPFVGLAGAFGAAFSMMTSLKTRIAGSTLDDLKLNRTWGLIFARVLVGIGAGFVLFFFVRSGLLGGDAFPDLTPVKVGAEGEAASQMVVRRMDFAKLFIWCFIAGFSEKLVPNLLSKTEGRRGEQEIERPQSIERSPAVDVTSARRQPTASVSGTEEQPKPMDAPKRNSGTVT